MSKENIVPIRGKIGKLKNYLDRLVNGVEFQIEDMPRLNKLLCGFERRKMIVIGARPSEGKSTFALQLAYNFSRKFKVLYLSLEMTEEEAMFRIFCHEQRIPNTAFYNREPGAADYSSMYERFNKKLIDEKRLLIVGENIGKSWEDIDRIFNVLGDDCPDMIFLDYIGCIAKQGKKKDAIDDYIRKFRALAIKKNFCLFICSQINRQMVMDTREPRMEGLKETGFLEEHADKVILLHYPCKHNHEVPISKFKIIVSKNKNGMTGFIWCKFEPDIYLLREEDEPMDLEEQVNRSRERVDVNDN